MTDRRPGPPPDDQYRTDQYVDDQYADDQAYDDQAYADQAYDDGDHQAPAGPASAPFDIELDADEPEADRPEADRPEPDNRRSSRGRSLLRGRGQQADAQELLARVATLVGNARPVPLSASAMINKEEILELLDEALDRLPDELREARWLRKEREEYLAKVRSDGDEILDAARAHAERLVQRTEVVKASEHRARRIIEGAESEARRLRLESEDFCDQKLAGFEIVLERTLRLVNQGREKLQAANLHDGDDELTAAAADRYFDQPRRG